MRPRPVPALVVVAASASLLGAGRLWFSALKSDRVVTAPPALHAPPLVPPTAPQPPLVVHAAPVTPVPKPAKTVTKHAVHLRAQVKATPHGVGAVSIIVDIGSAADHTQTQQPVAPPKPIVIPPLPTQPSGHPKPKPKPKPVQPPKPKPKPKPVTPPTPVQPTPAPTPTPTPTQPVATPAPPAATPPVTTQTPPPSTPPVVTPTPSTPPAGGTTSPPVVNGPQGSEPDTRPGNGWGDQNHVHTGPPGQNKKSGD